MNKYLISALLIMGAVVVTLLFPRNGSALPSEPPFTVVYSGDAIGKIEPCG